MAIKEPEKIFKGLKPNTSEKKDNKWVQFHDKKLYLMPIITRKQKFVPHFKDGAVTLEVKSPDEKLNPIIEEFFSLIATADKNNIKLSMDQYACFLNVVRTLLLTNYDFNDEELQDILTMNMMDLYYMFNNIIRLIMEN